MPSPTPRAKDLVMASDAAVDIWMQNPTFHEDSLGAPSAGILFTWGEVTPRCGCGTVNVLWRIDIADNCTIPVPDRPSTASYDVLQLPDGKTISGKRLQTYSQAPFFERLDGGSLIVMRVPGPGVPTPGSKYPRCELEENRTWKLNDGCAGEAARLAIYGLPESGDIVIGQIHQKLPKPTKPAKSPRRSEAPRPPVELHYVNGMLRAEVMKKNTTDPDRPRTRLVIVSGIALNQPFSYAITLAKGGLLTVTVNHRSQSLQLDASFDESELYFKAGNYCQDVQGGSSVGFEGLSIAHHD